MHKILVVDDEVSICKALFIGLSSEKFKVDVATNGSKGIQLGCKNNYDVLITDLCLPDMDGINVIREIKQTYPEIISMVITGNANIDSSIEAIRLEVNDYLEKPLSLKDIKKAIVSGLKKQALKQEIA